MWPFAKRDIATPEFVAECKAQLDFEGRLEDALFDEFWQIAPKVECKFTNISGGEVQTGMRADMAGWDDFRFDRLTRNETVA
jgi:hypothetical protein